MAEIVGISVAKAAQRYGLHVSTVFRHIKAGAFATYKIGKRRVVDVQSFDLWARSHVDRQ